MSVLSAILVSLLTVLVPAALLQTETEPTAEQPGGPGSAIPAVGESRTGGSAWMPPVDAPIVDFFRQPSNPYGAGNRGLEYGTSVGEPVRSVSAGEVLFAGSVGRSKFVVIGHGPHLRSTYGFLDQVLVAAGERIEQSQLVAHADVGFHLTARVDGRYVDPLPYFGLRFGVRLVTADAAQHRRHQPLSGPR